MGAKGKEFGHFGNYDRDAGFHAFFCIFEKHFPVTGQALKVLIRQKVVSQRVIFWHSFPIYPYNHAIVPYMQTRIITLFFAVLVSAFGRLAAQVSAVSTVTPTLMLGFTGKVQNNTAQLNWTMESQTNCKWFVIERSGDTGGYIFLTLPSRPHKSNTKPNNF